MGVDIALSCIDASQASLGNFVLVVNGSGAVSLLAENGDQAILQWDAAVDAPRVEKHSDGNSIRIGFKRFVISSSHSPQSIDNWMANVFESKVEVVTQNVEKTAADISRLNSMFESGNLTAEEFVMLVTKATHSVTNDSPHNNVQDQKIDELDKRADLAEFQRLWLSVFKNNVPDTLDSNALYVRLSQIKRELDDLPRDWVALSNLVKETYKLSFLELGQISNEITRAIKKNKPLPPLATQAINQMRAEMNSLTLPIRNFAKRMGWREMPSF